MNPKPLLTISGFVQPSGAILDPIVIMPGNITWVVGPNGSGKSTLLKWIRTCIAGILTSSTHDEALPFGTKNQAEPLFSSFVTESEVGYLPQGDNMDVSLPLTLGDVLHLSRAGHSKSTLYEDYISSINQNRSWNDSSGGERKKVLLMIIAAMAQKKLFLLDEPSNHLDTIAKKQFGRWLSALSASGASAMVVTHESPEAFSLSPSQLSTTINLVGQTESR